MYASMVSPSVGTLLSSPLTAVCEGGGWALLALSNWLCVEKTVQAQREGERERDRGRG